MKVDEFITRVCVSLDLPQLSEAAAFALYAEFDRYNNQKLVSVDSLLMAASSIYLSSKMTESARKLRDVINKFEETPAKQDESEAAADLTLKNEPNCFLPIGAEYWNLRDSVITCELLLLRIIDFSPAKTLVYHHFLIYMDIFLFDERSFYEKRDDKEQMAQIQRVFQFGYDLLNRVVSMTQFLDVDPQQLALAVVFLAIRKFDLDRILSLNEFVRLYCHPVNVYQITRKIQSVFAAEEEKV